MVAKKVVWTSRAKSELISILEFFSERNGNNNYSLKLLQGIEELTSELSKHSQLGRLTSDKQSRVIPFKSYLLFYQIDESVIEILSFWDNRQDSERLDLSS